MNHEHQTIEYKSIQKIRTGDKGFANLAVTCVAFANAQGGKIFIGYDDKSQAPETDVMISQEEANNAVTKLRSRCFDVILSASEILIADNNSHYFIIYVSPTINSIASTSDGKFYIRIADKCEPVHGQDMLRLASEKQSIQWELITTENRFPDIDSSVVASFCEKIRKSERVANHIKQMSDIEIAESYNLVNNGLLTYLGVLWFGTPSQRSHIAYPITVQYIVYDQTDKKIRKRDWHDNMQDPLEMLLDVEKEAVELTYSYEFPNGLFRTQIRHYNSKVIRELLLNAFAHKAYTISGDIMIEVYPDRLEITNPGSLPLGVTKDNILHQRIRRNPHLIRIMHDLGLMEGEGSGYDLVYELNARDAKKNPVVESEYNQTKVTQYSGITNPEIISLIDYAVNHYSLSQKNIIALGIVAQLQKVLSTELSILLQLTEDERLRSYTDNLVKQGLLVTRGIKKGNAFLLNPKLITAAKLNQPTTLKTVEPHTLEALIIKDLELHPNSLLADINSRLTDADYKEVRKLVYDLVKKGKLTPSGPKSQRRYSNT
ncbi:hypothetical protein E5358_07735 [Palleniella muris]|uniref:Uncharacterized protein n=1 Tax=Palleniella muris TaxID=3038145 RepID=A0AC61QPW5_9BACT|nr:ATP-binding protein [Palleniella muris]TGX82188.1 hypothetical protein E5358_07735 [Palleniella muris]